MSYLMYLQISFCILNIFKFPTNWDGDYISIQDIDLNENKTLVAHLTGPDVGPKSESVFSNWDKKVISTSSHRIYIKFTSDDAAQFKGFSANIYFTPISNKDCESWLDINKKIIKSPNYPQLYHISMKCSWLISVDHDYHIILNFTELYVRYQIIK